MTLLKLLKKYIKTILLNLQQRRAELKKRLLLRSLEKSEKLALNLQLITGEVQEVGIWVDGLYQGVYIS